MTLHLRWAVLASLVCLVAYASAETKHFHFPPVEPRQLELQLDLSATTYEPCWAVRWEGRHAHPIAAALRTALAVDVGARVKLALPTARVTSLRLVCTDPPKGQIERRLRARLTIAAAHPRWRLPPGAAATLLAALRQDVLRTWAAGTANALPKPVTEKQRGFGLLHLFAYKDPRQAPVCIHGVSLPGLPSCPPDSLRWDPALQATYSECTPTTDPINSQTGCPYDIWHFNGYPECFKCVDGKCLWDEYKYAGVGTGVDRAYCINGWDVYYNSCQEVFHPSEWTGSHQHLVNRVSSHGTGNWWMENKDSIEECCVYCMDKPNCIGFEWHPGTVQKCRVYTDWKDADCESVWVQAYQAWAKMDQCSGWTY